jgi:pimeloyl-ACP methyl ester carboxylesterase
MLKALPLFLLFLGGTQAGVETKFIQVQPAPGKEGFERTPGQDRAVVLIHGIRLHPFNSTRAAEPIFHDWQQAGSSLVKALGKEADVYAYSYGQTMPIQTIADGPALTRAVGKLKAMGYKEVILVGHSAGGLLARLFVEDHADSGVTKVIQICTPNDGSSWAKANFAVCKDQELFVHSLTKKERCKQCVLREDKKIPEKIGFCCLVGVAGALGDGVVNSHCQWSGDLQKQGIPAMRLNTSHFTVMRSPKTIDKIVELIREPQPRWTPEMVEKMRKSILADLK